MADAAKEIVERLPRVERTVFYAPTARRHFFTRTAAARAEARALLVAKYPTERAEPEVGDGGWHWSSDERLLRVYERLSRFIARAAIRARSTHA